MRLIDADALKEEINLTSFWDHNDYGMVKKIIDNAPTVELQIGRMTNGIVIPIERPTGEWIRIGKQKLFECSICNGRNDKTNYCPNFGAYMKGEEE